MSHQHRSTSGTLARSQSPAPKKHHRHRDTRSRSPDRRSDRDRDRQDQRHHHRHHRHRHHGRHGRHERHEANETHTRQGPSIPVAPVVLPYQARELSKRDLERYEPLFGMYLDIQKGILLEELPEDEVKGRWKSFIHKWNRGELAEGWYDPSMLEKANQNALLPPSHTTANQPRHDSPLPDPDHESQHAPAGNEDPDEDYGPMLPSEGAYRPAQSSGPTIPNLQDLQLQRELAASDAIAAREESYKQDRAEFRAHKSEIRNIQDEIAPRAEPGTHERRLEKRREAAAANKAFAESRRGGSPTDAAPDDELMGSGENDLDQIKKAQEKESRKKNEREIRREEILRARAAEREERLQKYRQKEEETIGWLKTLAKQRFG
ncbi:hypothetical protein ASPZODRAFT_12301 [Penicilliopsis zonata CBS 506.65]|uniref:Uncharacterized protein n=1 Tax=Penicilliopsis zonata CBS 506.65 TaxID=1073090 RepID=A0A1L9SWA4_9EURO|nr:hypothetical protein ASPZODRAFT_12301 [Penicilliopsis zonata CBS 506.65]OJJ51480.1 hypothetical protein ASPZODRAFT_12301 [Penicilliopsis zonata CBS 506.65]